MWTKASKSQTITRKGAHRSPNLLSKRDVLETVEAGFFEGKGKTFNYL
jgi:hypothetical protein